MTISTHAASILKHGKIAVLLIDQNTVVDVSDAAAEYLGIPRGHLKSQNIETILPGASLLTESTMAEQEHNGRILSVRKVPLEDTHVIFLDDITDQRKRDDELRRTTAELRSALESLPFDFWMNDTENRTVLQNEKSKALWGDMYGAHMDEVTSNPEILRKWRITNQRALAGVATTDEITYQIKGEERTYQNIVAPVRDGSQIIGILGLNIDITDFKKAVQNRDLLLKELHHRIKNHLQIILSMIAIQREGRNVRHDDIVRRIEEQIHTIYLIHEQLYRSNDYTTIDLVEYFRDITGSVQSASTSQIHTVVFECEFERVRCSIETAIPVGIIVNELIQQTLQKARKNSQIRLSCVKKENRLSLEVSAEVEDPDDMLPNDETGMNIIREIAGQIDGTFRVHTDRVLQMELLFCPQTL